MKDVFTSNSDIQKTAYLNWRMQKGQTADNLETMADSFASSAKILIQSMLDDNRDKKADSLIFPALFCIDHAIELYLKAILREIALLKNIKTSGSITHDIKKLYNKMIEQIQGKDGTSEVNEYLRELENYIDELYSLIVDENRAKVDFARYPVDSKDKEFFYIKSAGNTAVNIEELRDRFELIEKKLSGLFQMYQSELEEKN